MANTVIAPIIGGNADLTQPCVVKGPVQASEMARIAATAEGAFSTISEWPQTLMIQGKVWQRIKGAFSKVFSFVKKALPVAKTILPAVLPGPVGAGAAAVLGAVDTATNVITAVANANKSNLGATGEEEDAFIVTPEVRECDFDTEYNEATNPDGFVDPTTEQGEWIKGEDIRIPVNSVSDVSRQMSIPKLLTAGADGKQRYIQSRLKVKFIKRGPVQALRQYKACIRLGSQFTLENSQEPDNE